MNLIALNDVREKLGLSEKLFRKVLKEYKITIVHGEYYRSYINKDDVEWLKERQIEIYNELVATTYTYSDIVSLYKEIGAVKPGTNLLTKNFSVDTKVPLILKKGKHRTASFLYDKERFDKYFQQLKTDKEVAELCYHATSDYHILFERILVIENVVFSKEALLTGEFWLRYVKKKLLEMDASNNSSIRKVSKYRQATKFLIEFTRQKELFDFSLLEINIGIFNDNVPKTYRLYIYSFLLDIKQTVERETGKRLIDITKINFKHTILNKKVKTEKDIYSVKEYMSLYTFVSDYENHKKLCIEDVKKAVDDKKRAYMKYDSTWLYVLLHMNNGWRNGDIIEFPRFQHPLFNRLNLDSIQSLETLQLTYTEAEQIVKYYQSQWFEHNKTKEKATFYCSSVLTMPMAYAILLCEFRCRRLHLTDEPNLIHFYTKGNRTTPNILNAFFKNYVDGFEFKSRKMNRTVLTLTSAVIESNFQGDNLDVAQHLRGHLNSETTNTYIQLPQEHLDFITEQLFDTGYFGYIYNQFNQLLIGDVPAQRIEKTKKAVELRELLGDVVKLEDTTSYLKLLSEEREDVGKFLKEIPKEELKSRLNLINLGLSPAKEETYQCFFSSCITNESECNKCPFSIPHFYSLSVICKRINRIFKNYKAIAEDSKVTFGEKNKLYNLLLKDYISLMEAKQKFGTEIVEMFIDKTLYEFIEDLDNLPDPHQDLILID